MSTILHRIKAWLYLNLLTENPNDYIARVNSERSLSVSDICSTAVSRGSANVSAPAMEHAVSLFFKEMAYQMCDGYSVNTGWFTSGVHIRGVFDSPDEQFDPKKHSILFEFHQGALLRKELELVTVDILGMADAGTVITQVIDAWTSSVNDVITPGRNLKIEGRKIKIAGANGANGVYFKKTDDTLYMQLDPRDIVTNNPSKLIIVIPYNLSPGQYHVEVATQYSGSGNLLKEIRRTVFDKILTVNPPQ